MSHNHPNHDVPSGVTEPDFIDFGAIVKFAIGLTVVVVLSEVAMVGTYHLMARSADAANPKPIYPLLGNQDRRRPPEPRLQGGVQTDNSRLLLPEERFEHNPGSKEALKELRAGEEQLLTSFGWVDKTNQVVRIPVADAMKLTLERGLPAREATPSAAPAAAPSAQEEKSK